ncbi:hypothetical protein [Bacillus safensis]|uniref:hypothetical protein n=1 Tax=Bacillus safensis TaxID=561879 RepID=UPI00384C05DC
MEHIKWIFSGVGLLVINFLKGLKEKTNKDRNNSQNINLENSNNNILAEKDINITNTITNNIYETEQKKKVRYI